MHGCPHGPFKLATSSGLIRCGILLLCTALVSISSGWRLSPPSHAFVSRLPKFGIPPAQQVTLRGRQLHVVRSIEEASTADTNRHAEDTHRTLLPVSMSLGLATLLVVTSLTATPAFARDGTIAPPTCVSIVDAKTNCPARQSDGARKSAEAQLVIAKERLAEAEKAAGGPIELGVSQYGEPEMVQFWEQEIQRLDMNRAFLKDFKEKYRPSKGAATAERFVGRLSIEAPDVEKEEKFWCEALGMQQYGTLPGGGVLVAYGPPGIQRGEEGAFFGVEIRPLKSSDSTTSNQKVSEVPRLSFVQIATPSLIRISRVTGSGGELVDGYGFYGVKSPSGVQVRAYVDDRRDPVEFVAVAVPLGQMESTAKRLEEYGLVRNGPYQLVSPTTQNYMPLLPDGNLLLRGGDPRMTAQVLLLPEEKPKTDTNPLTALIGRGPTMVLNADSSLEVGMLDEKEKPEVIFSDVQAPTLSLFTPASQVPNVSSQDVAEKSDAIQIRIRSIEEVG